MIREFRTSDIEDQRLAQIRLEQGTSFTYEDCGEVVVTGGFAKMLSEGRWACWMDLKDIGRTIKLFTSVHVIQGVIEAFMSNEGVDSVLATASTDWPKAQKFLEVIGFNRIGGGNRYVLYERVC